MPISVPRKAVTSRPAPSHQLNKTLKELAFSSFEMSEYIKGVLIQLHHNGFYHSILIHKFTKSEKSHII